LQIPESDSWYAGRLLLSISKIPLKGEVITIGTYHFVIEEATNKKIELVKMTVKTDFFRKVFLQNKTLLV
jgi:Mg2+/Co2+ transporter CorC